MSELQDPEIFRIVLDTLETGVWLADRNGKILFWNQGAERITGYKRHNVVGRSIRQSILSNCDSDGCVACGASCPLTRTLHDGKPNEARLQLRHKGGHPVHVLMRVTPIRDAHGSIIALAPSFDEQRFASERERSHPTLVAHGCVDEVTGMPNREFTEFNLNESLATFVRYQLPFGVMCIRVDQLEHFRLVYGHPAGGAILRVVAQTLRNSLRPSDFLGRWSEDEFLAILPNCDTSGVELTGDRMRKVVNTAGLQWWGDKLTVTTSVGHASAHTGDTFNSLMQRAGLSLQQASDHLAEPVVAAASASAENSRI